MKLTLLHGEDEQFRDFDYRVGMVARAWNQVSYATFILFHGLSGMPRAKAEAVFLCFRGDGGERDVTQNMAKAALREHPELLRRVMDLMGRVGSASGLRNDAIHHVLGTDIYLNIVPISINPARAARLRAGWLEHLDLAAQKGAELMVEMTELINEISEQLGWPKELP